VVVTHARQSHTGTSPGDREEGGSTPLEQVDMARPRIRQRGGSWQITVCHRGERVTLTEKTKADAQAMARYITEQQLAGVNVVDGLRAARGSKAPRDGMPTLERAMTDWFTMRSSGPDAELRYSSVNVYMKTLGAHCFKFQWQGQLLGETPVDRITTKALVAMMTAARSKGSGRAVRGHLKHPLNALYRYLIKSEILPAGTVNPAANLGDYLPKVKRSKVTGRLEFFEPMEVETLIAAGKVFFAKKDNPHVNIMPFVQTALGTGARWGELAALKRSRINRGGKLDGQERTNRYTVTDIMPLTRPEL
jgi:integrase